MKKSSARGRRKNEGMHSEAFSLKLVSMDVLEGWLHVWKRQETTGEAGIGGQLLVDSTQHGAQGEFGGAAAVKPCTRFHGVRQSSTAKSHEYFRLTNLLLPLLHRCHWNGSATAGTLGALGSS